MSETESSTLKIVAFCAMTCPKNSKIRMLTASDGIVKADKKATINAGRFTVVEYSGLTAYDRWTVSAKAFQAGVDQGQCNSAMYFLWRCKVSAAYLQKPANACHAKIPDLLFSSCFDRADARAKSNFPMEFNGELRIHAAFI